MDLSPLVLVVCMLVVLLVIGMVLDQISMMMITLPFFMPLALAADINTVWLGVMMLLALEIGLLTPPFGLLIIVMQSVVPSSVKLTSIYRAALPFLAIEVVFLIAILFIPGIATVLPNLIN